MRTSSFVLTVLVAAAVAAIVTFEMHQYGIGTEGRAVQTRAESPPPTVVDAPNLVGLRPEQARPLLESRGLRLVIAREQEDAQAEAGKISRQEPLEGSRLQRGDGIRVVLARPVETTTVPSVIGRSSTKAKELLTQAGFVLGNVRYQSNEERGDGLVLEQSPAASTNAAKGSKVDLTVNRLD
jgi:serine/threonine-protein kinase